MKKEKITTTRIRYTEKCKECKKLIIGFSESNLRYNLEQHKGKHQREETNDNRK